MELGGITPVLERVPFDVHVHTFNMRDSGLMNARVRDEEGFKVNLSLRVLPNDPEHTLVPVSIKVHPCDLKVDFQDVKHK